MPRALASAPPNAAELAQRLTQALSQERIVPRFVDSYVVEHSRHALQVHATLYRELLGDLKITYVHTLDEVLEHALEKEGVAPPIVPQAAPKQKRPDSPRAVH